MRCAAPPDTPADVRPSGSAAGRCGSAGCGSPGATLRRAAGAWLAAWLATALAVQAHAREAPAAATEPAFEQILVAGEYRYARSRRAGVHVSFDRGHTWQARSTGLPHRVAYPFPDPPEYATVTSLAADPANPRRLAATTASAVFVSTNGGMAWQPVAIEQVHPHAYFTSVALSPHDPAGMLLGTSFHGVYETTDGGANWHHLTPAIRFLTEGALFYEEVAGLSYDPAAPRAMVVLAGFDGGIFYVSDRFGEERESPGTGLLRYPVPAMATIQLGYAAAGEGWELHAGTVDARWRLTASGAWSPIGAARPLRRSAPLQPTAATPAPAAIEPPPAADPPPRAAPDSDAPRQPDPDAGHSTAPAPSADSAQQPATDAGRSGTPRSDSGETKVAGFTPGLPQAPSPDSGQPRQGDGGSEAPQQPAPAFAQHTAAPRPAAEPATAAVAAVDQPATQRTASEQDALAQAAEPTAAVLTAANRPSTRPAAGDQDPEAQPAVQTPAGQNPAQLASAGHSTAHRPPAAQPVAALPATEPPPTVLTLAAANRGGVPAPRASAGRRRSGGRRCATAST